MIRAGPIERHHEECRPTSGISDGSDIKCLSIETCSLPTSSACLCHDQTIYTRCASGLPAFGQQTRQFMCVLGCRTLRAARSGDDKTISPASPVVRRKTARCPTKFSGCRRDSEWEQLKFSARDASPKFSAVCAVRPGRDIGVYHFVHDYPGDRVIEFIRCLRFLQSKPLAVIGKIARPGTDYVGAGN